LEAVAHERQHGIDERAGVAVEQRAMLRVLGVRPAVEWGRHFLRETSRGDHQNTTEER
jgi:hypothetical protein